MKKAFDQTVRDLKREVNKKVLKVPSIEQKVLDATSNEPWGPHGSHLADIAQATRNYHEYQMIMLVIWKRISDTGKNWRHVYKALAVLEYLVAHGSERVIDEIREHAYQISTLSDFQYIDSSGRDQGSNVRKKSQSLVVLVNDKERIQEVRQKAAANRDKYRSTSTGGMYRPTSGAYGDRYDDDRSEGRYGNRDEDRNGYGREREWGSREDDKYGRYGDSYNRDGDRYGRESEENYSRDGYRDDDYRGRSQSIDDYQYGSRSRSSDRGRDGAFEDDGQYSSSIGGRPLERKYSEQNLGAPPSYDEVVGETRSPVYSGRDGETPAAPAPKSSSPPVGGNQAMTAPGAPAPEKEESDVFDEFDPRGSFSAAPNTSIGAEMDLLGSLSDSFSSNTLATMPTSSATKTTEADDSAHSGSGPTYVAAQSVSIVSPQPFEDPFGDGPFKAVSSIDVGTGQPPSTAPTSSFHPSTRQSFDSPEPVAQDFGDTFLAITYAPSSDSNIELPSTNPQLVHQELSTPYQNTDILADILPPPGPSQTALPVSTSQYASQTGFPAQPGQSAALTGFQTQPDQLTSQTSFPHQAGQHVSQTGFPGLTGGYPAQAGQSASQTGFPPQNSPPTPLTGFSSQMGPVSHAGFTLPNGQPVQPNVNYYGGFHQQSGYTAPVSHVAPQIPSALNTMTFSHTGSTAPGASSMNFQTPQVQPSTPMVSQQAIPASTGSLAIVPQPAKDKFETKSSVWADTLSRGLIDLNISGSKTNPLADIGVDFEAINRKEKRMEKPTAAPVTSNVTMGKAMGSGSGIGRAGTSALRAPPNPMIGSGIGMGFGGGPGAGPSGIGMGGYGVVNQPMGVGMGTNMGVRQGMPMQPPTGFPPGSTMPGGYNPMMGTGGYGQRPYGGGY